MTKTVEPTWIWYPGDFEIALHEKISVRRQDHGRICPPFWRLDACWKSVIFRRTVTLDKPETISIHADGEYRATINNQVLYTDVIDFPLPAGTSQIRVCVYNKDGLPAIFVQGEHAGSSGSWEVSTDGVNWVPAGFWNFHDRTQPPRKFRLETREQQPAGIQRRDNELIIDFGKETFGYLKLLAIEGKGKADIYFGESQEEMLSNDHCTLLDQFELTGSEYVDPRSRAFRFVRVVCEPGVRVGEVSILYEYLPVEYRGKFKSSNQRLNEIWDVAQYTLHLTTREFFFDGIKRDRWVWSGDSYQSALMNYYSFFELAVTRRSLVALRGKDPVTTHINLVLDYSFFWFIAMYDYFLYTGDSDFIKQNYKKMVSLMAFCLARRNQNGLVEGLPGDWVYVDWADMDLSGEVSIEQLLFVRSLEVMAEFAQCVGDKNGEALYSEVRDELRKKIVEVFWDDERKCFLHNRKDGLLQTSVTRYTNMFAVLFDYLDTGKREAVKTNVLLNDQVQKITTPYMRFNELAALCEVGEHAYVMGEILNYWGGMLDLGATSFWEAYDPRLQGKDHYAFYGEPFAKSLCHAWGASPIYLLGKYYLGVKPLTPGYETYLIEPNLGGLEWIQGTVPMPNGEVNVEMNKDQIKVKATAGTGRLRFVSSQPPKSSSGELSRLADGYYELLIEPNLEYVVAYH